MSCGLSIATHLCFFGAVAWSEGSASTPKPQVTEISLFETSNALERRFVAEQKPKARPRPQPVVAREADVVSVVKSESPAPETVTSTADETSTTSELAGGARGVQLKNEESRFLVQILRSIERRKVYPQEARRERLEGRVLVRLVLREDGTYEEIQVAESSRFELLDEAALRLIRQIEGQHRIPTSFGKNKWVLRIPVNYSIR